LDNAGFAAADSSGGLRVFNAASGAASLDAFVGTSTSASASGVTFGNGSAFFSVPAGTQTVTLNMAGTNTTVVTAANQTFAAGVNSTLVVTPPASGTTALQFFVVPAC
jgi:hypothetical protein